MKLQGNTDGLRWRSISADDILWAEWDDDYVAYHRPSGKTHFLNASSALLLTEILVEAKDAASVTKLLSPSGDLDISRERVEQVMSMLARLEHLGLVERA